MMLNNSGFDLWADGYDKSVGVSDEGNVYPFAGYKKVMNRIFGECSCVKIKIRPVGGVEITEGL